MKHFAPLAFAALLGCSIHMEPTNGTVEHVQLATQAIAGDITCSASGMYPQVSNLASTQVAVNINSYFDEYAYQVEEAIRRCPEELAPLSESGTQIVDATEIDYEITRFDDTYLSVVFLQSQYVEGTAHPNNTIDTFVFDMRTGQPLTLADFFQKDADYLSILEGTVQDYASNENISPYPSETSNPIKKFYVTGKAIVLVDLYDVHSLKAFEVAIPFAELEDVLRSPAST